MQFSLCLAGGMGEVYRDVTLQVPPARLAQDAVTIYDIAAGVDRQYIGIRLGAALEIAIQVADALATSNPVTMVTESGLVKVLDFGLAKPACPILRLGSTHENRH